MAQLVVKSRNYKQYEQRLRNSKSLSESHWQRAIDNYKHYFGRLDVGGVATDDLPFYSQMSLSISYNIVESVMPRLIGKDPEFVYVAQEPGDVAYESVAKIVTKNQYENAKLELLGEPIYLKLQRMVKEALITGNAVGRPMWRRQTRQIARYVASLKRAGIDSEADIMKVIAAAQKLGKEDEVRYGKQMAEAPFLDDFDLSHKPFFHFFPDVAMVETGRMRFQIERELMTVEELRDEAKRFGYDAGSMSEIEGMVAKGEGGFTPETYTKDFMQEYNDLFSYEDQGIFATDDEKIPLLMVDKEWNADGTVSVYVNEKWEVAKKMPSPYDVGKPPFIYVHDIVIPHSYYSRGEIDAIKRLEDGANDLMNMRFDNLLQSMLNYWLYNPKLIASDDEFVPIPNSTTAVKDVEKAVRVISGADVTPNAWREADNLIALMKEISGINDYTKGDEGATLAGRTYGGMRLAQEMANARFVVKSRLFEKVTLKSLGYFILEFSRQFMSKDRIVRYAGDTGSITEDKIEVGKLKSIQGFMDLSVIPNSSQVIDQQAEALKLNAIADRMGTDKPPFNGIPQSVMNKFLLKYFQAYGIHDAVYWVRAIEEAQGDQKKVAEETQPEPQIPAGIPQGIPQGGGQQLQPQANPMDLANLVGGQPPIAVGGQDVIQSDQIASQPDPLEQLLNSGLFAQ